MIDWTTRYSTLLWLLIVWMAISVPLPAQEAVGMAALYCPSEKEIADWRLTGGTQQFEGDDLFLLINGGAEIYHEYGFIRVLAASYQNSDDKKLNLEIYEMENDASAFGVYSFKTAPGGTLVEAGDEALLEDYYLNMWNGRFLVTIIGFDSSRDTVAGLKTMAVAVAGKLKATGKKPPIVSILPKAGLKPGAVTYLEGPLGFYNRYSIDPEDVFGIRQAVLGRYGDAFLMVSKYPDALQRGEWYKKAFNCFTQNPRIKNVRQVGDILFFTDHRGQLTTIKAFQNYIFLSNGFPTAMVAPMYKSMEFKIQENSR